MVFQHIVEGLPRIFLSVDLHLTETSVCIQRNAAMVENHVVICKIHAAFRKKKPHMFLQMSTVFERSDQMFHHILFFFGQPVRIFWIDGWKMSIL